MALTSEESEKQLHALIEKKYPNLRDAFIEQAEAPYNDADAYIESVKAQQIELVRILQEYHEKPHTDAELQEITESVHRRVEDLVAQKGGREVYMEGIYSELALEIARMVLTIYESTNPSLQEERFAQILSQDRQVNPILEDILQEVYRLAREAGIF